MEYELAYYDSPVHPFNHYTTSTAYKNEFDIKWSTNVDISLYKEIKPYLYIH